MISCFRWEVSDETRRRVRLALGFRGGLATRKEYEAWVLNILKGATLRLPETPVRARVLPPVEQDATETVGMSAPEMRTTLKTVQARREAAEAAPEETKCRHCGYPKSRHGKMGFSCPAPHRKSFEAV